MNNRRTTTDQQAVIDELTARIEQQQADLEAAGMMNAAMGDVLEALDVIPPPNMEQPGLARWLGLMATALAETNGDVAAATSAVNVALGIKSVNIPALKSIFKWAEAARRASIRRDV